MSLTLSILDAKTKRPLTQLERLNGSVVTVGDVKDKIAAQFAVYYKGMNLKGSITTPQSCLGSPFHKNSGSTKMFSFQ